jgi:hypothetical protein
MGQRGARQCTSVPSGRSKDEGRSRRRRPRALVFHARGSQRGSQRHEKAASRSSRSAARCLSAITAYTVSVTLRPSAGRTEQERPAYRARVQEAAVLVRAPALILGRSLRHHTRPSRRTAGVAARPSRASWGHRPLGHESPSAATGEPRAPEHGLGAPRPDVGVGGLYGAASGVTVPISDYLGPACSREVGPAYSCRPHPGFAARSVDSDADPVRVGDDDPLSGAVADECAAQLAPVPLRLDFARDRGTCCRCDLDGPLVLAHRVPFAVLEVREVAGWGSSCCPGAAST